MGLTCPNCGNQLQDGSRFCNICGTPVNTEYSSNTSSNNQIGYPLSNQNQPQLTISIIFYRFWSCSFKGRCSCGEWWLTSFCVSG